MKTNQIRAEFINFFKERNHVEIPRSPLVPKEDSTTLFTGSGMQPLIPYLLGAHHPLGDKLVNSQTCFRAEDVDEVGDSRHSTFFEMLGNWSLGAYFKKEQLTWLFEFLVEVLKLDPNRIYATAFAGSNKYQIERDDVSITTLQSIFGNLSVEPTCSKYEEGTYKLSRITFYDESKCWWSRSGLPEKMPEGEPGGPDSEVFYEFYSVEHDPCLGAICHPHCSCGRFVEIGNSVFMQFVKVNNSFELLKKPNVDFGGGLERLSMAANDVSDLFSIDLISPIISRLVSVSKKSYAEFPREMRIIADHLRASVFLALDGVSPSNTAQGYVLRRILRRAIRQALKLDLKTDFVSSLVDSVIFAYEGNFVELEERREEIIDVLARESELFERTLSRGMKEFDRIAKTEITGVDIFTLFDTYGFPAELSIEEAKHRGINISPNWEEDYNVKMREQRERSQTATKGMFKGGLADHSERTTKLHTATHLLYKALRIVLGDHVVQRGSNITPERLRFDFSHPRKLTPEELAEIERIVNENIKKDWPMGYHETTPDKAFEEGALGAFGDKYGEIVRVYTAGDPNGDYFSKEICGGPHVTHTGALGRFKILKEESSSAGVRRIKATVYDED